MAPNAFLRPCQSRARSAGSVATRTAELGNARDIIIETRRRAVQLDEQDGRRIHGISRRVNRRFHNLDGGVVHHLHGGRDDSRGNDIRHRVRRAIHRCEVGQQRSHRLRIALEPDGGVQHHAETSLRSDERAEQVVAFRFAVGIAECHHLPVGEQHGERDDVIECHAVLQAVWPAGILGHVPADGTGALAGGIGRVVQAIRRCCRREHRIHDAGLDDRARVVTIDRHDPLEAVQAKEHHVVGERTAGETRACSARHE